MMKLIYKINRNHSYIIDFLVWLRIVCAARVLKRWRITCFIDVVSLERFSTQILNEKEWWWCYFSSYFFG